MTRVHHVLAEDSYRAKSFKREFSGATFQIAGTLDAELDFVMHPRGRPSRTVQLGLDEAEQLRSDLTDSIDDVRRNCVERRERKRS